MAEPRGGYAQMKYWHDEAYKLISQALDLDERGGGDKGAVIDLYSSGATKLEKGVAVVIDKSSEESEKAEKLRARMSRNLKMAQGRVEDLLAGKELKGNQKGSPTSSQQKSSILPTESLLHSKIAVSKKQVRLKNKQPYTRSSLRGYKEVVTDGPSQEKKKLQVHGVDPHLVEVITNEIHVKDTNISFEDIVGLESAKRVLHEIVVLPAVNPQLFVGLRAPARGLLLFGPPGNGKTMLAKAVAHESNSTFLCVSASTLTSKYVGEGEKLVRALFAVARELQPTIIFIDEVDSLLTQRGSGEHDAMRRLKNEFLLQFDGMGSSDSDHLLVMAATNRPQEIDEAALRRFTKRIFIPLPDFEVRRSILLKLLQKHSHKLSERELDRITSATEGYSNSDMTALAKDAALGPIRGMDFEYVKSLKPSQVRPILLRDFESAMLQIRPSVAPQALLVLEEWNSKFGLTPSHRN